MYEEFKGLPPEDQIRAENAFLSMKLMAEFGAITHVSASDDPSTLQLQNQFLRHVIQFEEDYANTEYVPLGTFLDLRSVFPPLTQIPEDKREQAWKRMLGFLRSRNIDVGCCSPRVKPEELYWFVREELYDVKVPSRPIAGSNTCFIYDEFHPDREYEAASFAQNSCILPVFAVFPLPEDWHFRKGPVWLNQQQLQTPAAYRDAIKKFREQFDHLILEQSTVTKSEPGKSHCLVKGEYSARGIRQDQDIQLRGEWLVTLCEEEGSTGWLISGVGLQGLDIANCTAEPEDQTLI